MTIDWALQSLVISIRFCLVAGQRVQRVDRFNCWIVGSIGVGVFESKVVFGGAGFRFRV